MSCVPGLIIHKVLTPLWDLIIDAFYSYEVSCSIWQVYTNKIAAKNVIFKSYTALE